MHFRGSVQDKENRGVSRVREKEEKGAEGKKDGMERVPASGSQAGLAARELLQILNILDHQSLRCGNIRKYWPYICFSTKPGSMVGARPSALPAGNHRLQPFCLTIYFYKNLFASSVTYLFI